MQVATLKLLFDRLANLMGILNAGQRMQLSVKRMKLIQ